MVSTYANRPLSELTAVKDYLLSAIGGACNETAERLAEHLDAVQTELDRRVVPMIREERMEVDEEGCIVRSIRWACPSCDSRCRPSNPYCPVCGQGMREAA